MPNLRAHLRIHMVFLAIVIVVVLAVCTWIETQTLARVFLAVSAAGSSIYLTTEYRKESRLAEAHALVDGAVIKVTRGRRGQHIRYEFPAQDGSHWQGQSGWDDWRVAEGNRVWVIYLPDGPRINKPLERFLFYKFRLDLA